MNGSSKNHSSTTPSSNQIEGMEFEDILKEVGDYSRYQKRLILFFLIPAAFALPWFIMNFLFMVHVPDHWCHVPEVAASSLSISDQRALISPPGEKCSRYNISFTEFLSNGSYVIPNNTKTIPCDHGWQYDRTYYDETVATKWNLVCENESKNHLVLTLFYIGSIIGTPIYGTLSDKIGRKTTFFIVIAVTAISSISSIFMSTFIAFLVLKTFNGSLWPSVFQIPFITVIEVICPEKRTRINWLGNTSFTIGLCFLPLIAYLSRSWFNLGLATSLLTFMFVFYYKFIPESPRWLVSQERYEEAMKVMLDIAKKNGKPQDETLLMQSLQEFGEKLKKEKSVDGIQNSSLDIIKYPQIRKRFFILTINWMANILAYYGLQMNVGNLSGNEFINFALLALIEVPGYFIFWYAMEKYGRRWPTALGFLITGIACLLPAMDIPHVDITSSMIGKFVSAGTFMATYQQSSEIYPTVIRSLGMGLSSTVATIITLKIPLIIHLSMYWKPLPFVVIGLFCILSGILASFLPETLHENLPQSIADAEAFGKNKKFFSWNSRPKSISKERQLQLRSNIDETEDGTNGVSFRMESQIPFEKILQNTNNHSRIVNQSC